MAIYGKDEATIKAVELAKAAIDAGWFAPVPVQSLGKPTSSGKECAEFLGAFIKQLSEEIKSL